MRIRKQINNIWSEKNVTKTLSEENIPFWYLFNNDDVDMKEIYLRCDKFCLYDTSNIKIIFNIVISYCCERVNYIDCYYKCIIFSQQTLDQQTNITTLQKSILIDIKLKWKHLKTISNIVNIKSYEKKISFESCLDKDISICFGMLINKLYIN